jgi:hypothetical protein
MVTKSSKKPVAYTKGLRDSLKASKDHSQAREKVSLDRVPAHKPATKRRIITPSVNTDPMSGLYSKAKDYNIVTQRLTGSTIRVWCLEFPGVSCTSADSSKAIIEVYLGIVERLKQWPKGLGYPEVSKR